MSSRWTGFLVWALVALSATFWGMRLFAATRPVPLEARAPARALAATGPMTRLFGAAPTPDEQVAAAPESDRFVLQGVIAEGDHGMAIVSVDGQPPRSWRVGTAVDGDTTLIAVHRRSAEFGPQGGPSSFTLELPPPQSAATGTLPSANEGMSPAPAVAVAPGARAGVGAPRNPMLQQQSNFLNGNGLAPGARPVMPGGLRAPPQLNRPGMPPVMPNRTFQPPQAIPQPQPNAPEQPSNAPDEE